MHTYVQKTMSSKPSLSATSTAFGSGLFGCRHAVDSTLPLQRIVGNQAALHLLKSSMEEDDLESTTQVGAVQARLAIGQPGDEYEREADRIAEQIVSRGTINDLSHQNADSTTVVSIDASSHLGSTAGRPLETQDRKFFESRFHHDFADVRVFTDWKANQSALGLQARA